MKTKNQIKLLTGLAAILGATSIASFTLTFTGLFNATFTDYAGPSLEERFRNLDIIATEEFKNFVQTKSANLYNDLLENKIGIDDFKDGYNSIFSEESLETFAKESQNTLDDLALEQHKQKQEEINQQESKDAAKTILWFLSGVVSGSFCAAIADNAEQKKLLSDAGWHQPADDELEID